MPPVSMKVPSAVDSAFVSGEGQISGPAVHLFFFLGIDVIDLLWLFGVKASLVESESLWKDL